MRNRTMEKSEQNPFTCGKNIVDKYICHWNPRVIWQMRDSAEQFFEEIIGNIFPNMKKTMNSEIQAQ